MIVMTIFIKIMTTMLVIVSCFGCTDSRVQRPDDEAMMMYRDCMGGTSPQWDSSDASAELDSEHVASANAGANTRRHSRQHNECVQQAAWEEK